MYKNQQFYVHWMKDPDHVYSTHMVKVAYAGVRPSARLKNTTDTNDLQRARHKRGCFLELLQHAAQT